MTLDIDDLLDERPRRRPRQAKKPPEFLGKLHQLISRGLPDFWDAAGALDVRKLADHLGVSFQAIYKWFEREKIPPKRVTMVIALSKAQKNGPVGFRPLQQTDFWEFMLK